MRKDDFWDGTKWVADPARQQPDAAPRPLSARRWGKAGLTVALAAAMMVPFSAIAVASTGSSITVPNGVFAGTTTATVHTGPTTWVHATCYQSGSKVYEQYVQVDTSNQAVLTLGPTPLWTGGGASCNAAEGTWMSSGKFKVSATTTFSVSGG